MDKQLELKKIAKQIQDCKVCKKDKIGKAVPGEGNPDADIIFIGEAPGKNEAKEGRPFIGRSGKYLRSIIKEIGINEEDVFITSPVKYLPKHVTPTILEIQHGMIHTRKQIEIIDPKIIVLMGNVATQGILGEKFEILKRHGEVIERDGRKYLITFHPAYAIRFDRKKGLFKKDIERLKNLL